PRRTENSGHSVATCRAFQKNVRVELKPSELTFSGLLALSKHFIRAVQGALVTQSGKRTLLPRSDTMPCPEPRGEAMRRREFIKVMAGSAAAWPLAARAQPALNRGIGIL